MVEAKIFIQKPCHEKWEHMSPDEKGKFCSVCSKSVYDFTEKTNAEVINTIANSDGKICGRFLSSQVEVPQNYLQRKVI